MSSALQLIINVYKRQDKPSRYNIISLNKQTRNIYFTYFFDNEDFVNVIRINDTDLINMMFSFAILQNNKLLCISLESLIASIKYKRWFITKLILLYGSDMININNYHLEMHYNNRDLIGCPLFSSINDVHSLLLLCALNIDVTDEKNTGDGDLTTALLIASRHCKLEAMVIILALGEDPNHSCRPFFDTPLDEASDPYRIQSGEISVDNQYKAINILKNCGAE